MNTLPKVKVDINNQQKCQDLLEVTPVQIESLRMIHSLHQMGLYMCAKGTLPPKLDWTFTTFHQNKTKKLLKTNSIQVPNLLELAIP